MAFDFKSLPRCGAKAKSRGGEPCLQAAMRNHRCYWHGGRSKGASPEGIKKIKSALTKHGRYSKEQIQERKQFRGQLDKMKASLKGLLEDI